MYNFGDNHIKVPGTAQTQFCASRALKFFYIEVCNQQWKVFDKIVEYLSIGNISYHFQLTTSSFILLIKID